MSFGLCNAFATFQKAITSAFQQYLRSFINIFLDDFCVYGSKANHVECLLSVLNNVKSMASLLTL